MLIMHAIAERLPDCTSHAQQKVDSDRQRQELRESLTALRSLSPHHKFQQQARSGQRRRESVRPGGVTVRATVSQARALVEAGE
jgi:hypothetical protein